MYFNTGNKYKVKQAMNEQKCRKLLYWNTSNERKTGNTVKQTNIYKCRQHKYCNAKIPRYTTVQGALMTVIGNKYTILYTVSYTK